MKKLFSILVLIAFLSGFSVPLAQADYTDDRRKLLRKRIQIVRQMRKSKGNAIRYQQLRQRYRDIQNSLKNISDEAPRTALRVKPIRISASDSVSEKRAALKERRRRRLALRPIDLSNATDGLAQHQVDPEVKGVSVERGKASYYADMFNGRLTASGTIFSNNDLTAAHKTLPFGTRVLVRNVSNGNTIELEITDRGPFVEGRIIDLTSHAFSLLDNLSRGIIDVEVTILE